MGIRNFNSYRLKDIPNDYLPMVIKLINICNLESYQAFFELNNLNKSYGKFRFSLENIILKLLFLIYTYRNIANAPNNYL